MSNINIPALSVFNQRVHNARFSQDNNTQSYALAIIEQLSLIEKLNERMSFHLIDFRRMLKGPVDEQDFFSAVFFLARDDIGVLVETFSLWDESAGERQLLLGHEAQVKAMLKEGVYQDPVSGEPLSADEFAKKVALCFLPGPVFCQSAEAARKAD